MAGKRFLTQIDILINSTLSVPESGFIGFGAKSDGMYLKFPSDEYLILSTRERRDDVREEGQTDDSIVTETGIRGAIIRATTDLEPSIVIAGQTIMGRYDRLSGGWQTFTLGAGLEFDVNNQLACTITGGGSGTVTSVGLVLPSMFNVTGSPVTGSGTLTANLNWQYSNWVFAGPNGSNGTPSFRRLAAADIPNLPYDNYYSWITNVDGSSDWHIMGSQWGGSGYKGLSFRAGAGITLSAGSAQNGTIELTITSSASSGSTVYMTNQVLQSTQPAITWNAWVDVTPLIVATWGTGTYYAVSHVSLTKGTSGAGTLAMRIIDSNGNVVASAENYHFSSTTNRMTIMASGCFSVKTGSPSSVKVQLYSTTGGWQAVATTAGSNSGAASILTVMQLS